MDTWKTYVKVNMMMMMMMVMMMMMMMMIKITSIEAVQTYLTAQK